MTNDKSKMMMLMIILIVAFAAAVAIASSPFTAVQQQVLMGVDFVFVLLGIFFAFGK